jgi:hypothetical protein
LKKVLWRSLFPSKTHWKRWGMYLRSHPPRPLSLR